jgi:hypothetical protein
VQSLSFWEVPSVTGSLDGSYFNGFRSRTVPPQSRRVFQIQLLFIAFAETCVSACHHLSCAMVVKLRCIYTVLLLLHLAYPLQLLYVLSLPDLSWFRKFIRLMAFINIISSGKNIFQRFLYSLVVSPRWRCHH